MYIGRFGVNPGESLQLVLKALATEVVEGRMPPTVTVEDIVEVVRSTGGIRVWRQRPCHHLVD